MTNTAIKIESVSKLYRLGTVGTGTMAHDLNRWWHQIQGKVGQVNDRTKAAAGNEKRVKTLRLTRHSPLAALLPTAISAFRLSCLDENLSGHVQFESTDGR